MNTTRGHNPPCATIGGNPVPTIRHLPVVARPKRFHFAQVTYRNQSKIMAQFNIDTLTLDPVANGDLVEDAIAWSSQHGLVYGAGNPDLPVALVPAPVALIPVTYPRETFVLAKRAATAFNSMIDAVSCDEDYLRSVLEIAARHDEFTGRLLQVFEATSSERAAKRSTDIALAINRSDYMLHSPTSSLLQVELNTIASTFGCLST